MDIVPMTAWYSQNIYNKVASVLIVKQLPEKFNDLSAMIPQMVGLASYLEGKKNKINRNLHPPSYTISLVSLNRSDSGGYIGCPVA
jgi:hypothetical protein